MQMAVIGTNVHATINKFLTERLAIMERRRTAELMGQAFYIYNVGKWTGRAERYFLVCRRFLRLAELCRQEGVCGWWRCLQKGCFTVADGLTHRECRLTRATLSLSLSYKYCNAEMKMPDAGRKYTSLGDVALFVAAAAPLWFYWNHFLICTAFRCYGF